MIGDPIPTKILSLRILPNADPMLLERLQVPRPPEPGPVHRRLRRRVLRRPGRGHQKGHGHRGLRPEHVRRGLQRQHRPGRGVHRDPFRENPADIRSGLEAAIHFAQEEACFYSAKEDDSVVYFAHCISRTGSYLSHQAQVPEGTAMAYLIAPPLEAMVGLDAALKAADVTLRVFYGPPRRPTSPGACSPGTRPPAGPPARPSPTPSGPSPPTPPPINREPRSPPGA